MTQVAYVSLGSNLDHPLQQVSEAAEQLAADEAIELVRLSPWYGSAAVGPGTQPNYVNGVAELQTTLTPEQLLHKLQQIELQHGRVRAERWGARTLDLDLLWFGGLCINTTALQVPHPRISERNFVLFPLNDIAPELVIDGEYRVADLASQITSDGIWKL